MKKTNKQKLAMYGMVPVTMSLLVVGMASADTGTATGTIKYCNKTKSHLIHKGPMDNGRDTALAGVLGMTVTDLQTALSSGKTIDTLITEKGLNRTTVMQTLRTLSKTDFAKSHETEMQARIQADIVSGKITQTQADQMKAEHTLRETKHKQALADILGISLATLETEMQAGKTMDQLATEHGLTTDSLKTKLDVSRESEMKADLAERVTSGKITQSQADSILANKSKGGSDRNGDKGPRGGDMGFEKGFGI